MPQLRAYQYMRLGNEPAGSAAPGHLGSDSGLAGHLGGKGRNGTGIIGSRGVDSVEVACLARDPNGALRPDVGTLEAPGRPRERASACAFISR